MTDAEIDLSNGTDKIPVATAVMAVPVPYNNNNNNTMGTNDTTIPSNQQPPPAQEILRSSLISSFSTSNVMTNESLQSLHDQGFPIGLAQELGNTKATYPLRFWIIDNSGYVCVDSDASVCYKIE